MDNDKKDSGRIKFHYGFYGAIKVIYGNVRKSFSFLQEQQLGKEPVRLDMLAIRKDARCVLSDPIGCFFRKHNILDYKSPEDALNINDFYKTQGYACIYKSRGEGNEVRGDELTISIFRHACPRKMFSVLAGEGRKIVSPHPGIYHVTGPLTVPAQVVVTSQLPEGEYEALKLLTRGAREDDILKFLADNRDNRDLVEDISAVLTVSVAANEELFKRLEAEGIMSGAFERVFHKELTKAREDGISVGEARGRAEGEAQGRARGIFETLAGLIRVGSLSIRDAASRANMTEDEFTAQMAALGI